MNSSFNLNSSIHGWRLYFISLSSLFQTLHIKVIIYTIIVFQKPKNSVKSIFLIAFFFADPQIFDTCAPCISFIYCKKNWYNSKSVWKTRDLKAKFDSCEEIFAGQILFVSCFRVSPGNKKTNERKTISLGQLFLPMEKFEIANYSYLTTAICNMSKL